MCSDGDDCSPRPSPKVREKAEKNSWSGKLIQLANLQELEGI
jgi:hypothetical protein